MDQLSEEKAMSKCYVCGPTHFTKEFVNELFEINGKYVLVEAIPAKVCSQCGEIIFSSETVENVRSKVHSEEPNQSISVF